MAVNYEELFDISPLGDQPDLPSLMSQTPSCNSPLSKGELSPPPKLSASLPSSGFLGPSSGGSSESSFSQGFKLSAGKSFLDELRLGLSPTAVDSLEPLTEIKSKRGRKPGQRSISFSGTGSSSSSSSLRTDMKTKLERSRQSARECRARKKLRYQYLDDLILERERANTRLREELLRYQGWCHKLDKGEMPEGLPETLEKMRSSQWSP